MPMRFDFTSMLRYCFFVSLVAAVLTVTDADCSAEEIEVPQPSAAALRVIGDKPVVFTGSTSPLVPSIPVSSLGTSDFTIGLSFQTDSSGKLDLGDLVSWWDAERRHGLTLGLRNNTGSTTSQPNWRQLQFGIDAGTTPAWHDEGRPGNAILGFSIAVHDGHLYVGTCEGGQEQVGRVYRYRGPGDWEALPPLDGANAVTALASFNGQLYAGTGKYRLSGSSLGESANPTPGGKIYKLSAGNAWELIGDLAPTEAVGAIVAYGGKLYASSLYQPAGFFEYEGENKWRSIPTPNAKRVQALAVHDGALYAGSYDSGAVYRFDGAEWEDLGPVASDITQTYSFATYQNALHVSTWPTGKVYRLNPKQKWVDCGRLGDELEVMGMLVHNGSFYGGTLPKGEVYRYGGGTRWERLKQIDETPNVKYRRVWTMATYQGRLFTTTLPSGKVWSMSAGTLVTNDQDLTGGWHQVVAQRKGEILRLFVDGNLVGESRGDLLDIDPQKARLTIGEGPRGRFVGEIKDLWLEVN